jgi:hypothetical protein
LAGDVWHSYVSGKLRGLGFAEVESWDSTFFRASDKVLISLYVDDFLVSGPRAAVDKALAEIGKVVMLGEASAVERHLGCNYSFRTEGKVKHIDFNMSDFTKQCVSQYRELAALRVKESISKFRGTAEERAAYTTEVNKLLVLSKAPTPFLAETQEDDELSDDESDMPGVLASSAAAIVMKLMFAARVARPDLLRACTGLSSFLSKWKRRHDYQLKRLMSHVAASSKVVLRGFVGDDISQLHLRVYVDSDYAGCAATSRSTSGAWLELAGPSTSFPLGYLSKKQTAVARSSAEAEIAAADHATRREILPLLDLLEILSSSSWPVVLHEDNTAAKSVIEGSRSKELRHLGRTHKISVRSLQEVYAREGWKVDYIKSELNKADVFTKSFSAADKWSSLLKLLNME